MPQPCFLLALKAPSQTLPSAYLILPEPSIMFLRNIPLYQKEPSTVSMPQPSKLWLRKDPSQIYEPSADTRFPLMISSFMNSPSYLVPLDVWKRPLPLALPLANWPSQQSPVGHVILPLPWRSPLTSYPSQVQPALYSTFPLPVKLQKLGGSYSCEACVMAVWTLACWSWDGLGGQERVMIWRLLVILALGALPVVVRRSQFWQIGLLPIQI